MTSALPVGVTTVINRWWMENSAYEKNGLFVQAHCISKIEDMRHTQLSISMLIISMAVFIVTNEEINDKLDNCFYRYLSPLTDPCSWGDWIWVLGFLQSSRKQ